MQVRVKRISTKELEVGSFYLCDRARADFSSINVYVGKNFKNYYVFYNVMNIRVSENKMLRLTVNKKVNLGTDNMIKMYKEVIQESLTGQFIPENIRIISGLSGVFNKIDFGFTAKQFVEQHLKEFCLGTQLKRVSQLHLNTKDIYISSDMEVLYKYRGKEEISIGTRLYFDMFTYDFSSINTSTCHMLNIGKMYKLSDVLSNVAANKEFRRVSPQLYAYVKSKRIT